MRTWGTTVGLGVGLSTLILTIGPATASERPTTTNSGRVVIAGDDVLRVDRQSQSPVTVTFLGVSRKVLVTVKWGDGSPNVLQKGKCSEAKARSESRACSLTAKHSFAVGDFTVVASMGRERVTKKVKVVAAPTPWTAPPDFNQPANWSAPAGARFTPCQNIQWYFDRTGEPANRAGTLVDLVSAFAVVGMETGLSFTSVPSPDDAEITVTWRELSGAGPGAAAVSTGGGGIIMATDDSYAEDRNGGLRQTTVTVDAGGSTYQKVTGGRGWLLVRFVGMVLGLFPVDDPAQVMTTSYWVPAGFGSGDLDGLHTMYKNQPCPLLPD